MTSSAGKSITFEAFHSQLRSRFQVVSGPALELELVEARKIEPGCGRNGSSAYEVFSLIFDGPDSTPLVQATHALQHATLGKIDLFLVPIGRTGGSIQYEAVFNRPLRPS